jgi:hypothetical protein
MINNGWDSRRSDHIRHNRVDTFDVSSIRSMTVWEQILHLASNPVYLFTVLALVCAPVSDHLSNAPR